MTESIDPQTSLHHNALGDDASVKSANSFSSEMGDQATIFGNIKLLNSIKFDSTTLCCRYSPDGSKIAVGLADGCVKICLSSTGEVVYHLPSPMYQFGEEDLDKKMAYTVTSLHFFTSTTRDRGEKLVVTYSGGMVKLWHIATSTVIHTYKEKRQTLVSEVLHGNNLVTGGNSDALNMYDIETGKLVKTFQPSLDNNMMDGHRLRVLSIKRHPAKAGLFVSGGWDDTVQVWDMRQAHAVRRIFGPHICGGDGIDIDPVYDHILTSSWRKNDVLQVWDFKSGEKIQTFRSDYHGSSMLYCGLWLGKKHVVTGGSDKNMLKITNKTSLETTAVISNMDDGVFGIDLDRSRLTSYPHPDDVTSIAVVTGANLHVVTNTTGK